MAGHEDEMKTLARETIVTQPLKFAVITSKDALRQFTSFRTGDEIREINDPNTNGVVIQQSSRRFQGVLRLQANSRSIFPPRHFCLHCGHRDVLAQRRRMPVFCVDEAVGEAEPVLLFNDGVPGD